MVREQQPPWWPESGKVHHSSSLGLLSFLVPIIQCSLCSPCTLTPSQRKVILEHIEKWPCCAHVRAKEDEKLTFEKGANLSSMLLPFRPSIPLIYPFLSHIPIQGRLSAIFGSKRSFGGVIEGVKITRNKRQSLRLVFMAWIAHELTISDCLRYLMANLVEWCYSVLGALRGARDDEEWTNLWTAADWEVYFDNWPRPCDERALERFGFDWVEGYVR